MRGSRLRCQGAAGAAQKALAGEIDARAEKLSAAPDDQFVLTSDGTIRWTGDAVAKLVAADDALHPRLRIISDERLSGAPREAVQTRLDLWLKTHIEKLLGPAVRACQGRGRHGHRPRHRVSS
jgi:ATP-dependent RNA helicase SUPV3L1/SUV3